MFKIETKRLADGDLHVTIVGKIDAEFHGAAVQTDGKVVLHLGGVRAISSIGIRAFESFLAALPGEVVMIHVSAAIASQLAMNPTLLGPHMRVESAKLPFACPACGSERAHSVPFRAGADISHAPQCSCGTTMVLDGLSEQFLPT